LVLPPDYTDEVPAGYIPVRSKTYNTFVGIRSILASNSQEDANGAQASLDIPGWRSSLCNYHWSVVAACVGDSESASEALARLCRDYWPPLYTFARRRGHGPADAQDIVQGFFAYLLESKAYARTDSRKGKFRSFLLASFKNYMSDVWDRARALKRGADYEFVLLDDEIDAVEMLYSRETTTMTLNEEQQYERNWAAALVARALERIRTEFNSGPKTPLFDALKPK